MKGLIVDDEARSRRLLKALCEEFCPTLQIIEMAESVEDAKIKIDLHKPDLVFLDIQMPILSGFSLLEHYENDCPFEVILTTAHDRYALQAIKFFAIDYLLKPIDINDLIEAVNKAAKLIKGVETSAKIPLIKKAIETKAFNKIALTTNEGFIFVNYNDIIRCEAQGNYTMFFLKNSDSYLITKTLKHYENLLFKKQFFRIHKSHLINLNYVRKFFKGKQGTVETIDGKIFEVSTRKREALLEHLNSL